MPGQDRGRFYEDFNTGDVIHHRPGRTVTEFDNTLWSLLTVNLQPLHLDANYSKDTEFGERLVNSIFTLGVVTNISTFANLGFEDIEFPHPVFVGDTIYAETEVLKKRRSKSRRDSGIVHFQHRGHNQNGELICKCNRVALLLLKQVENGG